MRNDVLALGLQGMLQTVTMASQPSLLWPGAELPSCLESVPSPSVWERQSHDFDELAYVESGNCVIVLDDKAYPVNTGSICIIPPGAAHYEAPVEHGGDYKLIWLGFISFNLFAHETAYSEVRRELLKTRSNAAWVSDDIKSLLGAIYREAEAQKTLAAVVIRSYFTALLALLLRQAQKQDPSSDLGAHPDPIVRAMAAYVRQCYADPDLTVGRIAAHVALSPKYFIEYMHKQTGFTPYNYLLQIRLEKARQYLTTTDWSVNRISEEVGFTSPYNFSATFKRLTGISPKQYRSDGNIILPF